MSTAIVGDGVDTRVHPEHPLKDGDVLLVRDFRVGLPSVFRRRFPYLQAHSMLNVLGCCSRPAWDEVRSEPKKEWRHFIGLNPVDQSSQLYRGVEFEVIEEAGEMWLEAVGSDVAVQVTKVAHKSEPEGSAMLVRLRCVCGETTPVFTSKDTDGAAVRQECSDKGWEIVAEEGDSTWYICPTCVNGTKAAGEVPAAQRPSTKKYAEHPLRDGDVVVVVAIHAAPGVEHPELYKVLHVLGCTQMPREDAAGERHYFCGLQPHGGPDDRYRGLRFEARFDGEEIWLKHPNGELTFQVVGVDHVNKSFEAPAVPPVHPLRDGDVVIIVQDPPMPAAPSSRTYFALHITDCTQTCTDGEWRHACSVYIDGSPVDVHHGDRFEVRVEGDRKYLRHPTGKITFLIKALVRD